MVEQLSLKKATSKMSGAGWGDEEADDNEGWGEAEEDDEGSHYLSSAMVVPVRDDLGFRCVQSLEVSRQVVAQID
jgi:hypothetical protein